MGMTYKQTIGKEIELLTIVDEQYPYFAFKDVNYAGYYKKGAVLGGFTFPKNEQIESNAHLLSKYGLYYNVMGVNLPGVLVTIHKQWGNLIKSPYPLFVGDFTLDGNVISDVFGQYNDGTGIWECECNFDLITPNKTVADANLWTKQIVQAIDDIKSAVDLLVASGTVLAPNGAVTFGNQSSFDSQMNTIKQTLEDLRI